ncbi:MAG: carboxylating nicotinate-nucleotide diphosphorylase [Alphaproteobacteria bacterium]|nr:carboxylating nicotinate-nucleotide diphosphorylase [Alphaproteobacteria bacterium]
MTISPLPDVMLEPLARAALLEDLGRAGDITTEALVPENAEGAATLGARQAGVVAGLDLARWAFRLCDPATRFEIQKPDGAQVQAGDVLATVKGSVRGLLMAERVALNFLGHLSGVATATRELVEAVRPHKAKIVCTRKTTPGLRALEKYAVRAGGGMNHRFGLDDALLIKDNHLALAGGIRPAVLRARERAGHLVKIELEVDSLAQLQEALNLPIDAVLLDNMTPETVAEAVRMVNGRFLTEASGRVTAATVRALAATGVDLISVGWITHSVPALDIGLDAFGG